jgi:hypothetical protein
MDEPIEETYFKWLYHKVASVDFPTPSLTYWALLRELHNTEFVWLLPGDDNRAEDGIDVRKEFLNQMRFARDEEWLRIPCSVLEMLIAFSRRAEFQTDMPAREWFWIFMSNLELEELNDAASGVDRKVAEILDRLIWRTYRRDGYGGLFPLHHTDHDQRKVEIWYQFAEYVMDQGLF